MHSTIYIRKSMFSFLLFIFICFLLVRLQKLSTRVAECEKKLGLLDKKDNLILQEEPEPFEISTITEAPPPDESPIALKAEPPEPKKPRTPLFEIPAVIKDNWIAFTGSLACIVGVIFFGITSSFFAKPIVRVALILVFSLALLLFCRKLKQNKDLVSLSRIFTSVAGVMTLFAAFGAGEIQGLKFIDSPGIALSLLSAGIGFNLFLSMRAPSQIIASIHVLFSLLALYIPAPTALFLPLGAIISLISLCSAYKSKWDLHLILITCAFALQNCLWTYRMEMSPSLHYLAIVSSAFVALAAAAIHYGKNYQSKELKALPCFAHLVNWGLFALNVGLHGPSVRWASLFLFAAAISGFILARAAKKRGISWLYHLDTLLSQVCLLIAIALLSSFSIKGIDLSMLAVVEMLLFIHLANAQKEKVLARAGYLIQIFVYGAALSFFMLELNQAQNPLPIFFRMGIVTALYWGSYLYFRAKDYMYDTFACVWFYEENAGMKYSLMALFGTSNFILISLLGAKLVPIQCVALLGAALLAIWRHRKDDVTWNLSFLGVILCLHLQCFFQMLTGSQWPIRIGAAALAVLDFVLVFKNMLQFKQWRRNFHSPFIYALAIQIALLTYACSKTVSVFIPTFAALAYSLAALEMARLPYFKRFEQPVQAQIQLGFLISGFGYILYYLIGFATVCLQFESHWHRIPIRVFSEILGILTLAYWIYYKPAAPSKIVEKIGKSLVDILLGFITLCIFAECPDLQRPLCWTILALGLLVAARRFQWPARLYTYSWVYLIGSIVHVAFITHRFKFPGAALHLHAVGPILLQLLYAYLIHTKNFMKTTAPSRWFSLLGKQPTTAILLPIFLGIALLFAYNFEKTLLTLLWVGLTSVYITLGLLEKNRLSIQIGMGALILCSGRLILFDLMQSNILVRALVFFCVGILMMIVGVVYKKYKHRITST